MNIEQIEFPALRVAAIRRVGPYGPQCAEAFGRLCQWACKNNLFNSSSLVIGAYYDCPKSTPPEKCRMDACITLGPDVNPPLEAGIVIQTLPGGLCASSLCNVYNNDFPGAWNAAFEYLQHHNAAIATVESDNRPCYEVYYGPCADSSPLKKWVMDIVIPLKHRF